MSRNGNAKFVSRNFAMIRNFNYRSAMSGAPFRSAKIERPRLASSDKGTGTTLGYWGGMTLDRGDFTTRRVDSELRRCNSKSERFQRYTKMSRFLSKRKVFLLADAKRDFDITPIRG